MKDSVIDKLKAETENNPAFKDVATVLATRKRTRDVLTVTHLKQAMDKEGFNHTRKEYESVLKFLGKLKFGRLVISKRGHVKALRDIKITLQSLGRASLDAIADLKTKPVSKVYESIIEDTNVIHKQDFVETKPKHINTRQEEPYPTFLTLIMGGKLVSIPAPTNVTSENVGEFIVKFKKMAKDEKDL